jgi:adenosylmethionine-8-amino-7-oxononanoate aminotransferase
MEFARQYFHQTGRAGKVKFIGLHGGYHGATFGARAGRGRQRTIKRSSTRAGRLRRFMLIRETSSRFGPGRLKLTGADGNRMRG